MIDRTQIKALRDLMEVATSLDVRVMLIGAAARLLMFDWKHDLPQSRTTKDWDLAVKLESWDAFLKLKTALTKPPRARFSQAKAEQRIIHVSGTLVDLIPFGGIETKDGTIVWPRDHTEMTVVGFTQAYDNAELVEIAEGLRLCVVTIPFLLVLKVVAFHDRRKFDDLRDILFILEKYFEYEDINRIFDELSDQLAAGEISFDNAGQYLIGRDVGRLCHSQTREKVVSVLDELLINPIESDLLKVLGSGLDSEEWESRRNRYFGMIGSFRDGLKASA
jgi:predicted nucleotidyltransferase